MIIPEGETRGHSPAQEWAAMLSARRRAGQAVRRTAMAELRRIFAIFRIWPGGEVGSGGRIRTYDQRINSPLRYRCATPE
jgi:hypothetical protein